jgi:hypothetical protein
MADTPRPLRCDGEQLYIIDQTQLPFSERELTLDTAAQAAHAIAGMQVRGAPLIGAIGAFGLALALREAADDGALDAARRMLVATRPTAVNLAWALERVSRTVRPLAVADARCGSLAGSPEHLRRRPRGQPPHRRTHAAAHACTASEDGPVEPDDPLQRRLARDHRLGYGAGRHLSGARGRHGPSRVGVGNTPAQPGPAHCLGTAARRRGLHGHRRQRCRVS